MIKINAQAPEFTLPDQNGKIQKLSDYKGSWVVLYFYPKDDTPGCTKEACSFNSSISDLKIRGVNILGVSKDSIESHKKFEHKYALSFSLLSDPTKDIITAYDAWGTKKFMGKTYEGILRKTFLINPDGLIVKIYEKVNPLNHTQEILEGLDELGVS